MDSQGNIKQQIEAALADMTVQIISERLPQLFTYYVGFELIDKNDDGTRAAGLLGFNIGDKIYYIPSLFMNGRIRGTEMIYDKGQDIFLSATKQWVDELIKGDKNRIGWAENYQPRGMVGSAQLRIFESPLVTKGAQSSIAKGAQSSIAKGAQSSTARGKKAAFDKIPTLAGLLQKAYDETALDFPTFLKKAGAKVYNDFMDYAMNKRPSLMAATCQIYNPECLKIAGFNRSSSATRAIPRKVAKRDSIRVIVDIKSAEAQDLPIDEKRKLMETGIAIVDSRGFEEKPKDIRVQNKQNITNPNRSGIYMMKSKDGDNEVFIGLNPFVVESPNWRSPSILIIDRQTSISNLVSQRGGSGNMEMNRPIVVSNGMEDIGMDSIKWNDFISNKVKPFNFLQVGNDYVLIRKSDGKCSMPFTVKNKAGERFRVETISNIDTFINGYECERHDPHKRPTPNVGRGNDNGTWLSKLDGVSGSKELYCADNSVFVPTSEWGIINLSEAYEVDFSGLVGEMDPIESDSRAAKRRVTPMHGSELNAAVTAAVRGTPKTAEFLGGGSSINVRIAREPNNMNNYLLTANGKTASIRGEINLTATLAKNLRLSENDSREMAQAAKGYQLVERTFVYPKTAGPVPDPHIEIPWIDVDNSGGATQYSGTPVVVPASAVSVGTTNQYDFGDPFDPATGDYSTIMNDSAQEAQQVVERAGQSNIKQVFDPAMIGMILRTSRVQLQVESEYLPALIKGVDRMCRLLLTFYWHNSEFSENYGQDELSEFEDVILTSIKTVGQLTLFLKQKSVGGDSISAFSGAI